MSTPPCPPATVPIDASPDGAASPGRSVPQALLALAKPRLAAISVLTTLVAYAAARPGTRPLESLALLAGTTAAAAGALSLNQWSERTLDARMRRTRGRPLPAGELAPGGAFTFSLVCAAAGVVLLALGVNAATALLAAATIGIYGLVYTPLKRRSRWATEIGAVSGALPALMGNAAAGELGAAPGLTLAVVLWFWQMPHFFALGWRHRADYRAAGFRLLPAVDPAGTRTAIASVWYAAGLLVASLVPWWRGDLGLIYGATTAVSGAFFLRRAWRFLHPAGDREAMAARLFAASLIYLPVMLVALVIDRLVQG
jgi:protoheme IX farnesyltransferase